MGLRINTNLAAIAAQRQLVKSNRELEGTMKALASGRKYDKTVGNSGDFAISEHLRGQVAGLKAARVNAENAHSFIQVAEGGLNEQNNIVVRLRELAVQAASDTYSDREREMLDYEFQALVQEFDRIAQTASFGSNKVLSGEEKEYEFQVGAYGKEENIITYKSDTDTRASSLNIDSLNVRDKSDARDALENVDEALNKISDARAQFGAIQSRLQHVVDHNNVQIENLSAAKSRIGDTDVAEAASDMYKQQALQQYQMQILSHANQYPLHLIKLVA